MAADKRNTLKHIQNLYFRSQLILIVTLALFLGIAGTLFNIHFETQKRDANLQNVAEAIAHSPILTAGKSGTVVLTEYLDSLKETLDDIDVISVVDADNTRIYHSNHSLIGTQYDGTMPLFDDLSEGFYTANETGPSGTQRRAYAAVYGENGEYLGFVMAIMLMETIYGETYQTLTIFAAITLLAILIELLLSAELFRKIKTGLLGYEPDVFTAMYRVRDNILESLAEGIVAVDGSGNVQFTNESAEKMLCSADRTAVGKQLSQTLENGEKTFRHSLAGTDILLDSIPIKEDDVIVGALGILHNRAEYTKLMEDLAGTRYLVDSMRANNHDFTNKLHVILGLIQMELYDEATAYIQNITLVQRESIGKIMRAVDEPTVAALLIGKTARAAELNVHFVLREGCRYSASDFRLPSDVLVTVIGNLLDNAFDAMNVQEDLCLQKELLFGIFSRPGALLITVDDTGCGIAKEDLPHVFDNGFSTKGEGRGTGLYQVKKLVESFGGRITAESQSGVGTSFSVSFTEGIEVEK